MDYYLNVKSPFQRLTEGISLAQQQRQAQQVNAINQRKVDVINGLREYSAIEDPTVEETISFISKFPEISEQVKAKEGLRNELEIKEYLKPFRPIRDALKGEYDSGGNTEDYFSYKAAMELYKAADNSGNDKLAGEALELAEMIKKNPVAAKKTIESKFALLMGADSYKEMEQQKMNIGETKVIYQNGKYWFVRPATNPYTGESQLLKVAISEDDSKKSVESLDGLYGAEFQRQLESSQPGTTEIVGPSGITEERRQKLETEQQKRREENRAKIKKNTEDYLNSTIVVKRTDFADGSAIGVTKNNERHVFNPEGYEVFGQEAEKVIQAGMKSNAEQKGKEAESVLKKEQEYKPTTAGKILTEQEIAKRDSETINLGKDASEVFITLSNMNSLLSEVETGGFNRYAIWARQKFGLEGEDEAALSYSMAMNVMNQLKQKFGSQFTEAEGQWLARSEANIGKSADANKAIVREAMALMEKRAKDAILTAKVRGDATAEKIINSNLKFDLRAMQEEYKSTQDKLKDQMDLLEGF